jgi:hypothetical protein
MLARENDSSDPSSSDGVVEIFFLVVPLISEVSVTILNQGFVNGNDVLLTTDRLGVVFNNRKDVFILELDR